MKRKWLIVLVASLVMVSIVASGALAAQRVDIRIRGKDFTGWVSKLKSRLHVPSKIWILPHQKSISGKVKWLPQLDLTLEQQKELNKLTLNFQKEILELNSQLREKQLELQELLLKDSPDEKEIDALMEEMGSIWTKLSKKRVNFWIKIRNLLTEEQWTKLGQKEGYRFFPGMGGRHRMWYRFW